MSWQVTASVLKFSRSSGTDRLIMCVLAAHADKDSFECFVGYEKLSEEANMGRRNLAYILKRLEELGEISITRGRGRSRLTYYKINLPAIDRAEEMETEKVQATAKRASDNPQQVAPLTAPSPADNLQVSAPYQTQNTQSSAPIHRSVQTEKVQDLSKKVQSGVRKGAIGTGAYKEKVKVLTCRNTGEPVGAEKLNVIEAKIVAACKITYRDFKAEKALQQAVAHVNQIAPDLATFDRFIASRYKTQTLNYIGPNFEQWLGDQKPAPPSLLNPPKAKTYCGKCQQGYVDDPNDPRRINVLRCQACNPLPPGEKPHATR